MANKQENRTSQRYDSSSLPVLGILGMLLIALGVLVAVAQFIGAESAFFGSIQAMTAGLGGCLGLGLAVLLTWGGFLVMLSSGRRVSFRAFLLVLLLYVIALALLNLLSQIGESGFFVEYCMNSRNDASYSGVIATAYRLCETFSKQGMAYAGGAMGMLLAWPAFQFLGTVGGTIVLIVLLLIGLLLLFRFNVSDRFAAMRESAAVRRQQKAQVRAQEEQQQRLWEQQRQEEENRRNLQSPAYLRRNQAVQPQPMPQPMQGYAMQPMMGMQPEVQVNNYQPVPQPAQQPVQPVHPAAAQPELYDEVLTPGMQARQGLWPKRTPKPVKVHQTTMTFTPSEMGYTDVVEPQMMEKTVTVTDDRRKGTSRLEEVRRRKAELFQNLEEDMPPMQLAQEVSPVQPQEPVQSPVDIPVEPQDGFHPLVEGDEDAPYRRPEPPQEPQAKMPESTKEHTPMFAPLVDMEPQAPKASQTPPEEEKRPYVFPPVDLLNLERKQVQDTHEIDQMNAQKLEKTLSSFGIPAKVQQITHGPAITRFAMGLTASGINVKRIQNIADNIALELAANGAIRIESQIPGTNLFGIEVPNKEVQTVTFAQVLMSPEMQNAASPLAVCLGHDITGTPVICDLSKMPHLLIAGQTGGGKSVCVNAIINSLLFRTTPDEVRMIMIDPKVVELQSYNVVPHLLIPVVTDPQKAVGALAWAVAEMEDRYKKMSSMNVHDLKGYNAKLGPDVPKLPRIVIVIDELADLMMTTKRDVEESIIRLAQKARAAGIHMVVATQRPTVDVITGLIKSNVPSRIAFAVSSSIDSRTILDKNGAEKLLGNGDMLYMPTGTKNPTRVQGCFLSDGEIERIVSYIEKYSRVEFDPNVLEALEKTEDNDALDDGGTDGDMDDRLEEAIEMVITDGQASISMLQRRMKIGYARAGRLIDDMANRGIVSKSLGSKPREVLITREEYDRIKSGLLG